MWSDRGQRSHGDARRVERHPERRQPGRAECGVDCRDHRRVIGDPEVRDEQLVAVEPVAVRGRRGTRLDRGDVAARLGLGQRECGDPSTARVRRDLRTLDVVAGEQQRVDAEALHREDRIGARRDVAEHLACEAQRARSITPHRPSAALLAGTESRRSITPHHRSAALLAGTESRRSITPHRRSAALLAGRGSRPSIEPATSSNSPAVASASTAARSRCGSGSSSAAANPARARTSRSPSAACDASKNIGRSSCDSRIRVTPARASRRTAARARP